MKKSASRFQLFSFSAFQRFGAPSLRFFISSAGALLLVSALNHLLNAVGHAKVLSFPDPLLGLPLGQTLLLAGALELLVAAICLFAKRPATAVPWLAWLSLNYIVYRLGLIWYGSALQCTCLGNPADPLHLPWTVTVVLLNFVPAYLLAGILAALLWQWRAARLFRLNNPPIQESTNPVVRMSCPSCGVHVKFARENLGQQIPCPQCRATVTLRTPDLLKMACFFCKKHVEFPPHAIGEKIHCPHCNMDITLKEPA